MESDKGGGGSPVEYQDAGLVVEIPAEGRGLRAENLLANFEPPLILAEGFVILLQPVVVESDVLDDARDVDVNWPVDLLGDAQSAFEHRALALHITTTTKEEGIGAQGPHQIWMVRTERAFADRQCPLEPRARSLVVSLSPVEHREFGQRQHQGMMVGAKSALLNLECALVQRSRLIMTQSLLIATPEGQTGPTDSSVIGPDSALAQDDPTFEKRLSKVILSKVHEHAGVEFGRRGAHRIVFPAGRSENLQRTLEGRPGTVVVASAGAHQAEHSEARGHRPVVGTQGLLVDRHRSLEERPCLGVVGGPVRQPAEGYTAVANRGVVLAEMGFAEAERLLEQWPCLVEPTQVPVPASKGVHQLRPHNRLI